MKSSNLTPEEIQELSKRVKLKILHEDSDVVLLTAPNDEELVEIVKELLRYKPMNLKEIHQILSGVASEDKIRKALTTLLKNGEVYLSEDGRYMSPSI